MFENILIKLKDLKSDLRRFVLTDVGEDFVQKSVSISGAVPSNFTEEGK